MHDDEIPDDLTPSERSRILALPFELRRAALDLLRRAKELDERDQKRRRPLPDSSDTWHP